MFNKILATIFLSLTFIISGCSWLPFIGDDEETVATENFATYKHKEFAITYPKDWEVVTAFSSKYGQDLKPLLGFKNKKATNNFLANVNVIKESVDDGTEAKNFAEKKIEQHQKNVSDFQELDKKVIEYKLGKDKKETILILFSGKYEGNTTYKFMQNYIIEDKNAYTITGTTSANENEETLKQIQTMLQSFELK